MLRHINLIIIASISIILLFSCEKKTEEAGLSIQPDQNRLKVYTNNLTGFSAYTGLSDPITTNRNVSNSLLGTIDDDKFGRTTVYLMSQYRLNSDNVNFGNNPVIVSVKAYLDITGFEGDTLQSMRYMVYESNFDIDTDSLYSSDIEFSANEIGSLIADEIISVGSESVMSIPLSNDFGQNVLNASSDVLTDNESFIPEFKGVYFTVDTNLLGDGVIWKYDFNSENSFIELEYTSTDANGDIIQNDDGEDVVNTFKLQFNSACGRFNKIINNTYPLANLGQVSDELYISGLGGTRTHINLAPVLAYQDSGDLMIYKAELIGRVSSAFNPFTVPSAVLMEVDHGIEDSLRFVDDISSSVNNFGGEYESDDNTYRMVITRHVQNLINKNHTDSLLWIYPYAQKTNPNRVIINNSDSEPLTLRITYSKLN